MLDILVNYAFTYIIKYIYVCVHTYILTHTYMCARVYICISLHSLPSFAIMSYSSPSIIYKVLFPMQRVLENYLLTSHCKSLEDTIISPTVKQHLFYTIIKLFNNCKNILGNESNCFKSVVHVIHTCSQNSFSCNYML